MKKVLFSVLGASAILAALLSTGCGTEPKGTEGKIIMNDTLVMGTAGVDTITLKDADLGADTYTVKVTSTADPVGINVLLTGKSGVYKAALGFSTAASAAGTTIQVNQNCIVTVTYKDAKPAGTRTQTIIWKAGAMTVALDHPSYQGITTPMMITLTDPNISSQTATVNVMSTSYPTPFPVTLTNSGVYGQYTGSVYFTASTAITSKDTVHVKNTDSVTVTYSSLVTPSVVTSASAQWLATSVVFAFDSADYHGTADQIAISLTNDHTSAATLVVDVSSAKAGDTVAITLTAMAATPSIFTGTVGFTLGAATATAVGVKDSDMVTVSYVDPVMNETKSGTVNWYSTQVPAFGLLGSHYTDATTLSPNLILQLIPWTGAGGGVTIDQTDSMGEDGVTPAVAVTGSGATWGGFGWAAVTAAGSGTLSSMDMTAYAACTLHVSIKSSSAQDVALLVENLAHTGQTWVNASTYGYAADGVWHDIAIPLSAWAATCDLSNVDYFLGVNLAPYVAGETVVMDNIYWTLPATATPAAKKLAKKLAK